MQIHFPRSPFSPIEVPRPRLLGVYGSAEVRSPGSIPEQLAVALARPNGAEPLDLLVRPGMRVVVIVDDLTSPTPAAQILPPLLRSLQQAGIAHQDLEVLVATGSGRPLTSDELRLKVGELVLRDFPVVQHEWRNLAELTALENTTDGYPVIVNRRLIEADLAIGVQAVIPDRVVGFSGGYSIVDPGCFADTHSTLDIQWDAAQYPVEAILGQVSNSVRRTLDTIGAIAGLDYVIQVVVDGRGEVVNLVSGAPTAAFQAAVPTAFQIYAVDVPERADVVIADASPYDRDLFLAARALYAASLAVRPGGAIVLLARCPEGIAPTHPEVLQHPVQPARDLANDLSYGRLIDVVAGAFLAMLSEVIERTRSVIVVSPGLIPEDLQHLGLRHAATPQEALEQARDPIGATATVLVLRQATTLFPRPA